MKKYFIPGFGLGLLGGGVLVFWIFREAPDPSQSEDGTPPRAESATRTDEDGQSFITQPRDSHSEGLPRTEVSERSRSEEEEIQKLQTQIEELQGQNQSLASDLDNCEGFVRKKAIKDEIWKALEGYLETIQDPRTKQALRDDLPSLVVEITRLLGKDAGVLEGILPNQMKDVVDLAKQVLIERNQLLKNPSPEFVQNPWPCYRTLYRKHELDMARILPQAQYQRWLKAYPPREKAPTPDFYCRHQH